MRSSVLVLLLASAGCTYPSARVGAPAPGSAAADSLVAVLDTAVPSLLGRHRVPAAGVALIDGGKVALAEVYGVQGPGTPASGRTLFNVASLTKPVALETILRLVAAGKISLDEPMWPHWIDPDVAGDPRHRLLTPRIALTHQTGFPNWRSESAGGMLAFGFTPGSSYGYSGEGYDYVARFAEKKLGRSFEALAQEYVFDPIGMRSTSFSRRSWMEGRTAIPADTAGAFRAPEVPPTGRWNAANNLSTTIDDYARFAMSVMNGEMLTPQLRAERLRIHNSSVERVPCRLQPMSLCPTEYGMALGWERFDFPSGETTMMHLGGNLRPDGAGESTAVYYDPVRRRGVVVLTSGRSGDRVVRDVIDIVHPTWPLLPFWRSAVE